MAKTPIATIKLAPGRVGFYDEYSRIHLTLSSPVATVYSGTNCAQLRKSVKAHVIDVISGSLGEDVPPFKIVKVNGKLKLASNVDAMHKPVMASENVVKAVEVETPVKEEAPVVEAEEVTEAVPEKEEAPVKKSKAKEAKAEEVTEEVKDEEPAEEVTEEVKDEEPAEEEKPKKKKTTRKKKAE